MKKIIIFISVLFIITGQVSAHIPEELEARVAWIVELLRDHENKLGYFYRTGINTYQYDEEGEDYLGAILMQINNSRSVSIRVARLFFDDNDHHVVERKARRYIGAYLTALESNGIYFLGSPEGSSKLTYFNSEPLAFVEVEEAINNSGIIIGIIINFIPIDR